MRKRDSNREIEKGIESRKDRNNMRELKEGQILKVLCKKNFHFIKETKK